jgi:hypothetical protein
MEENGTTTKNSTTIKIWYKIEEYNTSVKEAGEA